MEFFKDDLIWDSDTKTPLRLIIVGAGIAGLTTALGLRRSGHDVVVLEQVPEIAEIGAGIQMAPNCTRILGRFGILEEVMRHTCLLEANSLRRWENDEELGKSELVPKLAIEYNAPMGGIHRGDLQRILVQAVKDAGIEIRTSARVIRSDELFSGRVLISSGEWISGDVVIAADGIKSTLRRQIATAQKYVDRAMPTGQAAYRLQIPRKSLEHDETALRLLDTNMGVRWMGPGGHIMAYPIRNNQVYNMVLPHPQKPGTENDESWNRRGNKKELVESYKDWNQTVRNFLSYVPGGEVMEWTLNSHLPLPAWHENKVILVGDACHPMLPYVAQGGAQAIEDAGAIAAVFSLIQSKDDIPAAIGMYEKVRKLRAERIQNSAVASGMALHLPDGPEQQARDQSIRDAYSGKGQNPDLWSDREWQNFMWGEDVMKQIVEGWEQWRVQSVEMVSTRV